LKFLLLLISIFTFAFRKEVENEMAIPSEYRAINSGDVGRVAGVNFSTTLRVYVPYTDYDPYNIGAVEWSNGGYFGPGTTIDPDYTMLYYKQGTGFDIVPIYIYNTIAGTGGGVETDYVYIPRGATITSVSAGSTWLYMLNINAYNVSFNLNGAPGTPPPTQSVGSGYSPLAVTPPTWTNHRFLGWSPSQYAAAGSPTESITITQNITLYAVWEYTLYNVSYNTNGGNAISATVDVNALPNPLPTPTKEGYNFSGWYYDSAFTTLAVAGAAIDNDIVLYAKWTANLYNITYNANGGSPVAQMLGISRLPTPLPVTTKERSTFKGWYTNSLFIGEKAIDGQVVNTNMTLYAKFVEAIEYELDDGTENVIEKIIQPYNPSSNKIINQNKYFLYAPAAGLDKVGMAGYKSGDFDVNSKQIVSISNKFKKTVVQNVDVNSIPDNIIYDGVDGIKTTNVFYNNYTNTVIDTLNTNNVPSYINVTGTLLVSLSNYVDDSNYSMSEMFIANGRIWTRVLVVVNDEIIEVTDFTQLGKQENIDIVIQRGESEPEIRKGVWVDESVEGVGVDDVIVVKGTDLQVVGNVSGQIPVLQDLIVKGAEINLIEGSSGQIQISGGEITIVNDEGVEEILIDETLTVSSVDMVSGTKYITIDNVIPII